MRKWILLLLVLTGCSQSKGGGGDTKFLLPWRGADGKYELQEVTISTLASPTELRGEAAEIFDKNTFSDTGFEGSIARPHLTKSGDVYIPQDIESSIAVAAYAQFDRLFTFEREQGTRSQISWPRKVGVELNLTKPNGGTAHDNAHYFTGLDVIGLVPYSKDHHGVPVSLNQGIVAHEHFHAHFQTQVMNVLTQLHDEVVTSMENMFYPNLSLVQKGIPSLKVNPLSPRSLNNLILRSWNEGLADLFAGIYTGDGDFFTASLPQLSMARSLEAMGGNLWTGVDLKNILTQNQLSDEQKVGIAYGQGTMLARLMYQISSSGIEAPKVFAKRIFMRLRFIPEKIGGTMDSAVMDFDDVVPILLAGMPLNGVACGALNGVLMKSTMRRSFAKCAP